MAKTATSRSYVRLVRGVGLLSWLVFAAATPASAIELELPIACEMGRTCFVQNYVDHDRSDAAADYRCGALTYDGHDGTDFRVPSMAVQRRGVDVLAAADGEVVRVRDGVPDRMFSAADLPSVEGHECGNGAIIAHADGWETQYCHMARGSVQVKPGDRVKAGQSLGQVGLSGKTEFPHVHLTVRLRGEVVDPFAFRAPHGSCGAGESLWAAAIRGPLTYQSPSVLNTGFAAGPVTMEQVEAGDSVAFRPTGNDAALVAFVRAIGLRRGDVQRLSITAPDGTTLVDQTEKPLDRDKAQFMVFAGRKRPAEGFKPGQYRADYSVSRQGHVLLQRTFETTL